MKHFSFVTSTHTKIRIRLNVFYGTVEGTVSTGQNDNATWTISQASGLLIEPTDPKFRTGAFYITFKGVENSEFTVTVGNANDMIRLSEGLPTAGELYRETPAYFFYSIPKIKTPPGAERRLNLYVKLYDQVTYPMLYVRRISRHDQRMPGHELFDVNITWDNEMKQLSGTIPLPEDNNSSVAIAVEAIFPVGVTKARFDIVAWTTGIVLIVPGFQYMQRLSSPSETHVYELSVQQVSRLYVEVDPCVGQFEFFVSQKLAGIADKKHDLKKDELSKGKLYGSLEAPVGTYYISVRRIPSSSEDRSNEAGQYTIRTIISNSSDVDSLENFYLENYGIIDYNFEGDSVTLRWGKVIKRGSGSQSKVRYSLYLNDKNITNMYTVCGIKYGNTKKLLTNSEETSFTYNKRHHRREDKLVFNVIAYIYENDQTVAYNPLLVRIAGTTRFSQIYIGMQLQM